MTKDRESIGLTPENQHALEDLMARGWFSQGQDAARFCIAYAIQAGIAPGLTDATETRWAAGNFDKTGELKALLLALYPSVETPIRLMEHFVNQGIRLIAEKLTTEDLKPSDLLSAALPTEDDT